MAIASMPSTPSAVRGSVAFPALHVLLLVIIALALAACGGGGEPDAIVGSSSDPTDEGYQSPSFRDEWFLIAGHTSNSGVADGQGTEARFWADAHGTVRKHLAVDGVGNVYVNDAGAIRKVTPSGQVTTLAGLQNHYGDSSRSGVHARFQRNSPIVADDQGNVYILEFERIRKVSADGAVITIANIESTNPYPESFTSGGFHYLAIDRNGNLYLKDVSTIVKVSPDGTSSRLVHNEPTSYGYTAIIYTMVDYEGNVYYQTQFRSNQQMSGGIAPSPIYRLAPDGTQSTVPSRWESVRHIDRNGTLYFFEGRSAPASAPYQTEIYLMKQSPEGVVSAVGLYARDYSPYSSDVNSRALVPDPNGALEGAGSWRPFVADGRGNVYYAGEGYIGRINENGEASVHAGMLPPSGNADGAGPQARFETTYGITQTPDGNLHVLTASGIRSIDTQGNVTTKFSSREFRRGRIASDAFGNLYLAEGHALVRILPTGLISIVAGSKTESGQADGMGAAARFSWPASVTAGPDGSIYLESGDQIRKVTSDGIVTTVAGSGWANEIIDGPGEQATFARIADMKADSAGNLYVVDTPSFRGCSYYVRRVAPGGNVSILATLTRTDGDGYCEEGPFNSALAIDAEGDLYVLDTYNNLIHKVGKDGSVTRIAGEANRGFSSPNFDGDLFRTYDIEVIADNTLAITGGYGIVGFRSPHIGSAPR